MKTLKKLAALVLALALVVTHIPFSGAKASAGDKAPIEEKDGIDIEFESVKTTVSLTGHYSLFEIMKMDPEEWPVDVTVKVGIRNNDIENVYVKGGINESNKLGMKNDDSYITVKPSKKAYITSTFTCKLQDIIQSGRPTEKQALKLLNGKSVSVKTQKLCFTYGASILNDNKVTIDVDYEVTVQGGSVDAAYLTNFGKRTN